MEKVNKIRLAAEVHKQVRSYAQSFIQPGIKLTDMCERIEECNRKLVKENGLLVSIHHWYLLGAFSASLF